MGFPKMSKLLSMIFGLFVIGNPFGYAGVLAASPQHSTAVWSDSFKTLAPLSVQGGHWQVRDGQLKATNLGASTKFADQFTVMPNTLQSLVERSTVTLQALPRHGSFRVGLIARASVASGHVDKWALLLTPGAVSLLNENTRFVATVPFKVDPSSTYHIAMAKWAPPSRARFGSPANPNRPDGRLAGGFTPTRWLGKRVWAYIAQVPMPYLATSCCRTLSLA